MKEREEEGKKERNGWKESRREKRKERERGGAGRGRGCKAANLMHVLSSCFCSLVLAAKLVRVCILMMKVAKE